MVLFESTNYRFFLVTALAKDFEQLYLKTIPLLLNTQAINSFLLAKLSHFYKF